MFFFQNDIADSQHEVLIKKLTACSIAIIGVEVPPCGTNEK